MDLALWLALLPSAAVIAVITYIESYSIGTTSRPRNVIKQAQSRIGCLGAANVGAALSGASCRGIVLRSGVNYAAGAERL